MYAYLGIRMWKKWVQISEVQTDLSAYLSVLPLWTTPSGLKVFKAHRRLCGKVSCQNLLTDVRTPRHIWQKHNRLKAFEHAKLRTCLV